MTFLPPPSKQKVIQMGQMDREARRLGWSLVRSDDDFDEGDDYDDDIMDLEASNIILSPLLRSGRPPLASRRYPICCETDTPSTFCV